PQEQRRKRRPKVLHKARHSDLGAIRPARGAAISVSRSAAMLKKSARTARRRPKEFEFSLVSAMFAPKADMGTMPVAVAIGGAVARIFHGEAGSDCGGCRQGRGGQDHGVANPIRLFHRQ